jgi:hypothetical protein
MECNKCYVMKSIREGVFPANIRSKKLVTCWFFKLVPINKKINRLIVPDRGGKNREHASTARRKY